MRIVTNNMDRICLTNEEKQVLRMVSLGKDRPGSYPQHTYNIAMDGLERKGLVKVAWQEGHTALDAFLTDYGRTYLSINPRLRNPVDRKWVVTTAIAAIAAVAAVVALFVACAKGWR